MMRMRILITITLVVAFSLAQAQTKSKTFSMPAHARYAATRVMAKVKPGFQDKLSTMVTTLSTGRSKNIPVRSVINMVKPSLARAGAARLGPRAYTPVIDISRYFYIGVSAGADIEAFINQLYATGYFEIVEPDYVNQLVGSFTPNDPNINSQYYLTTIKAFDAWGITQGDTSVTIAIVDSGGQLNHPDLSPNLYTNWAEYPPNGVDDDGNGFIDDYRGWDFAGSDTTAINNLNVVEDNNPSVVHGGLQSHGTWVAGCASAATNNGIGMAGVGFKSKIMFTKHSADNQDPNDGSVYFGYDGVLYAANLGIKVINLSWGGPNRSQIAQDLMTHVTQDLGSLVVAAAGNSAVTTPFYPASYDHVLSVAATDNKDVAANFTNYGSTIDLSAPGVGIYTTSFGSTYNTVDGTSFSSPITAGAAALVWATHPDFTATQVGEQLRVSADGQALYTANSNVFKNKLGKGRLDISRALTTHSPSIRATHPKMVVVDSVTGKTHLSFDFTNLLENSSSSLLISISGGAGVAYTNKTYAPGLLPSGSTVSNEMNPFEFTISPSVASNTVINLLLTFTDGAYSDYQAVDLIINPSYIDVNTNQVLTTVTNIGRIGYQSPDQGTLGSGFYFDDTSLLFEMGLIMVNSAGTIYNNVRGMNGLFDQDFTAIAKIHKNTPGQRSDSEISGSFSNSATPASQAVVVGYRSLVWKDSPYDKFVILEYQVKNPTVNPIAGFHFGLFADWDISPGNDAANWYEPERLGYVYAPQLPDLPYAGIQALNAPSGNHYSIENDQNVAGNPFGLYDGFSDAEKITTMTTNRDSAGLSTASGTDVSHVVSAGPYTLLPGQVITIAFALHGAANFNDLTMSAVYADSLYNFTLQEPRPLMDSVKVCYNSNAVLETSVISQSGAQIFKWYSTFTGGSPLFEGNPFTTGNITGDTVFYVSNAEHSYESVRTPMVVTAKGNPTIAASGSTILCEGSSVQLSVAPADVILWSTGATTPSIAVSTAGSYSVTVTDSGFGCQSTSPPLDVVVNQPPTANFNVAGGTQSPTITLTDQSTGAVGWLWTFGDGTTSFEQNPDHTYTTNEDFSISLTVTASNGCTDSKTGSISIVTGLEEKLSSLEVYPNPIGSSVLHIQVPANSTDVSMVNSMGQVIFLQTVSPVTDLTEVTVPASSLQPGLYVIRIRTTEGIKTRKVVKAD